jgi:hypothetical protein
VWGALTLRDAWRLCTGLYHRWGLKCNRLDIALDDYARRITPIQLDELLTANPDYLCHGKSFEGVYHFDRKTRQKVQTTYVGSRKSDCFHRVYDALPVHDKDAIRWELQAKRKPAHTIYQGFCTIQFDGGDNCHFDIASSLMLGQFVVGCVDFRYCDGDRLSRRTRLEFWQSFVDEVGASARPTPPSIRDCLQRTKAWLDNQVAPMLAVIEQIMGAGRFRQYVDSLCASGVSRHRTRHENLISIGRGELVAFGV